MIVVLYIFERNVEYLIIKLWVILKYSLKILAHVQCDLCKSCQSYILSHSCSLSKPGKMYTMISTLLTFILNN